MPDFEDKIPLSEFSVTGTLHDTDRVPVIQANGQDWDNFCVAMLDLALRVVKDTEYTSAGLNTTSKKIIGAINEVVAQAAKVDIASKINTPAPIMTFNDGGDDIPVKKLEVAIAPSESGVTEVNIVRTGKNIYNGVSYLEAYITGGSVITSLSGGATIYAMCKPNTTYTITPYVGGIAGYLVG